MLSFSKIKNIKNFSLVLSIISTVLIVIYCFFSPLNFEINKLLCLILVSWLIYIISIRNWELKNTKIQYKHKKYLLDELLIHTPDLIFYKGLNSKIIGCNKSFCDFFNLTLEEAIGKTFFDFMSPEDATFITEKDLLVLTLEKTIEYEFIIKRGYSKNYLNVIKSPLYDENGSIVGISVFCKDITKCKLKENEKMTFIETLTHDLKTPVLAQIKALEFLISGNMGKLNIEQTKIIMQTISSCKFVLEMINSILSTHKFGYNDYKLKPVTFNAEEVITKYTKELDGIAYNKNIKIETDFSKLKNKFIFADKLTFQRIVSTLIFNALSYSIENTTLKIETEDNNQNLKFKTKRLSHLVRKSKLKKCLINILLQKQNFDK